MSRRLFGFALVLAAAVVSGAAASGTVRHRDAVGDVKGGSGPDITAVTALEQAGRIAFRVEFAKAPPLTFSKPRGYTDMLIIGISTTDKTSPKQANWFLGVHGADLKRVSLVRAGRTGVVRVAPAVVSGRILTLSLDPRRIGNPKAIRFSVAAGREMQAGGGEDYAPDSGTWRWVR